MSLSIYSPLNASKREIRLLHLLPGQDTDDIVCDLEHSSLAASHLVDYEPLSYTWGDPNVRTNITLCGQTFGITTNLHAALRHLRFKDRERVLWVDAVCINQEDIVERSEQVQLMTFIYGRNGTDKRAILWLGEESEDSPLAMHFLDSFIGIPMLDDADPIRFAFDSIQWKALRKLFNRGYWSRVWIMQEATLGGATLMCGYDLVPYKKFLITMAFIARYRGYAGAYDAPGSAIELAQTSLLGKLQESDLLSLLEVTNLAKATDPRDQLYGLLGLAIAKDRENIIPDYSKSLAQVYDDFVRYCIGSTKSLRCLFWERLEKGSPVTTKPTWRPVYCESHALSQMGTLNRHVAGSTEAECTISDDGLLQAKGFKFDIVEDIYPITRPGLFIEERGGIAVDIEALALKAQIRRRNKGNEHDDDDDVKDEEEELDLEPVWRTLMKDHPIFCPDWLKDDTFTWMKRCPDGYGDIYRWFTRNIPPPPGVFKPRHPLQSHDDFQIQFSNPLVMGFLALQDYTFFTTRAGRIGVGPLHTAPGDVLAVLYGGDVAFMLRSIGIGDEYSMVGLPFVYGINQGELVDDLKSGKDGLKEEILNIR